MTSILGYWDIRGLAQPIRNMLVYQGVEFEDKRYVFGPEPDFDGEEWLSEKSTLGLRFPNLPYYMDDDVKITQSLAILRYLARKHELAAKDEDETLELDMLEQQARDLSWGLLMAGLDWNRELNAGAFEGFPALTSYTKRFEELPNIEEYFASDKYNKYPILGPMLKWGFEKE
ncbi:hypothetical protein HPB52_010443 [Rhipicephalus sanguineus]|uniref:glutathione transferase n=1 Tax=Rhipicephalus sanguineus TaxID=34632 RepID=A0A9D4QEG9_RHISA|nr:hypothetical protein HPB52_010443 [Rhipicephalus sanguineus]